MSMLHNSVDNSSRGQGKGSTDAHYTVIHLAKLREVSPELLIRDIALWRSTQLCQCRSSNLVSPTAFCINVLSLHTADCSGKAMALTQQQGNLFGGGEVLEGDTQG